MPTVLRAEGCRFFFYSGDRDEPIHIHVECEGHIAKVWLDPIQLQNSGGFKRSEINKILLIIFEHQKAFQEAWDEYFSN